MAFFFGQPFIHCAPQISIAAGLGQLGRRCRKAETEVAKYTSRPLFRHQACGAVYIAQFVSFRADVRTTLQRRGWETVRMASRSKPTRWGPSKNKRRIFENAGYSSFTRLNPLRAIVFDGRVFQMGSILFARARKILIHRGKPAS